MFYCQKIFTIKKFLLKNFLQSKKNFIVKKIFATKFKIFLLPEKFFARKKKFLLSKNFLLSEKIFVIKKIFGYQKIFPLKNFFFDYNLFILKKIIIMAGILNHTIVDFY